MLCPHCQKAESKVIDSREIGSIIRRRRQCLTCRFRFTTREEIDVPRLMVIKKSGKIEPYDRMKLTAGITKACEKRPVNGEKIEELVDSIEQTVKSYGQDEIESRKIGRLAIDSLKKIDSVAYLRFASVYKNFRSPASFSREIKTLEN